MSRMTVREVVERLQAVAPETSFTVRARVDFAPPTDDPKWVDLDVVDCRVETERGAVVLDLDHAEPR